VKDEQARWPQRRGCLLTASRTHLEEPLVGRRSRHWFRSRGQNIARVGRRGGVDAVVLRTRKDGSHTRDRVDREGRLSFLLCRLQRRRCTCVGRRRTPWQCGPWPAPIPSGANLACGVSPLLDGADALLLCMIAGFTDKHVARGKIKNLILEVITQLAVAHPC
jgi:hypothetical protein